MLLGAGAHQLGNIGIVFDDEEGATVQAASRCSRLKARQLRGAGRRLLPVLPGSRITPAARRHGRHLRG
jgi:hypothetical protein